MRKPQSLDRLMYRATLTTFLLMAFVHAEAGTVLEMLNRDLTRNSESTTKTSAQAGKLRIETGSAESFAIFRDETFYAFDPRQKSYIAMDRASIKRLADQVNPALKMLQEQLANMSPEQRAQMERMLGQKLPGSEAPRQEEIRKTSRTATIAGYGCSYAEVYANGVLESEVCVTPAGNLKGSKELYDASVKVGALLKEMVDSIDMPILKQLADRDLENFSKFGGVPMTTRTFEDGRAVHESVVKSIRTESLADTLFDIPAGYRKQELPSLSGGTP